MATIDNAAKSCYDRIACNLATLASRYHGVPLNVCKSHAKTLELMKYNIRTAIGDSNFFYSNSEDLKIHGTGQGSSASPSIWLMISVLLMQILKQNHKGMQLLSVTNAEQLNQVIEGFVDDTSLYVNSETNNMDESMNKLQLIIQEWNDLLSSSGGKLELPKCFYYQMNWTFDQYGDPIPFSPPHPVPLRVKETSTSVGIISEKNINTAHKTLGVYKTIIGKETEQLNYLQQKSNLIIPGHLNRQQARTIYSSIYMPAMLYGLTAGSHSESQLESIQQKAIFQFLPCMGYERTFPRAVVFAPISFGGMNLGHLYVDGSYQKINTIISHIRANSELGRLVRITLDWTQLISGISTPILESHLPLNYLHNNWIVWVQQFLTNINGLIRILQTWTPNQERAQDKFIMEEAMKSDLTPHTLRILNNWRLYFRVVTTSDIATTDGTEIDPHFLTYQTTRQYNRCQSTIRWPEQGRPDRKYFPIWTEFIKTTFTNNTSLRLRTNLGDWLVNPKESRRCWLIYYSRLHNTVYYKHNCDKDQFNLYNYHTHQRSKATFQKDSNNTQTLKKEQLPNDSIPVTADIIDNATLQICMRRLPQVKVLHDIIQDSNHDHNTTISSYIKNLQASWHRKFLQYFKCLTNDNDIYTTLQS